MGDHHAEHAPPSGGQLGHPDRRVEVKFEKGYPAAQVFAPRSDDVVCFEPMAAPTDALRRGDYRYAIAGRPERARFSISVT
jgi:aldose 1-epimerase